MVLLPQVFGPTGALSGFFLNPANVLTALAFLIPLILLYLIRPKPMNVAVPSLMFILSDMGKSNVRRFFRTLFRDLLFLIQALAIILLGLAMAKPFINVSQESLVRESIIVIDTSASTRAFNDNRFDDIKSKALDAISSDNIIIESRTSPQVITQNDNPHLSAGKASSVIKDLQPTDTQGDMPTALDLATQYVGPETEVTIVSDFVLSSLENPDLINAKIKVLRSKGALVKIVPVTGPAKNVGIIDGSLSTQNASVEIKVQNFNSNPADFGLEYNGQAIQLPNSILAPYGKPGSLLSVDIPLAHGKSEITLTPSDDFDTDNHYYISIPSRDTINVLLISNDPNVQQSKLIPALNAAGDQFTKVAIAYGTPPKVPDLNQQIYILKDVDANYLLPGVITDLRREVENGAVLVVYAQPGLFSIDMLDMLPVTAKPSQQPLQGTNEILVNTSLGLLKGLSDIGQADGSELLRVNQTPDALVHAYVMTNDGPEPVIASKRIGTGAVIYYGIMDKKTVDIDPQSYAVIWGRIIDYSMPDPSLLNVGTGAVITSSTGSINTPFGKQASPVFAARAGFYQAGATTIAANLYPMHITSAATDTNVQYESLVGQSANISASDTAESGSGTQQAKVPEDLSNYVIILGIAAMVFELFYVKFRGDL